VVHCLAGKSCSEPGNDPRPNPGSSTAIVRGKKCILEKLPTFSSGLYYTNISMVETHAIVNQKFTNPDTFIIWHDRLGHPGSIMMRRIIENSNGHPLKNQKILMSNEFFCAASS